MSKLGPGRHKKKKLEPMTLDEITNLPAHEGMLSFLQTSPQERERLRRETARQGSPAIAGFAIAEIAIAEPAIDQSEGSIQEDAVPILSSDNPAIAGTAIAVPSASAGSSIAKPAIAQHTIANRSIAGRRPSKVHHCVTVQDAHSVSENALYVLLWDQLGTSVDEETKLVQISLSRLAKRAGMSQRNLQTVLERLEKKLTIEVASKNSFVTGAPKSYYAYSDRKILARRRAAGLEWVVKNKGVQFVSREEAGKLEALRRTFDDLADTGRPDIAGLNETR